MSTVEEAASTRTAEQFNKLVKHLVQLKALPEELGKNAVVPTTSAIIVPRLLELGVDDRTLANVLAKIFKLKVFNGSIRDRDQLMRSINDPCPWLIADNVLYVTNPYDRDQIEPLMRRNKTARDAIEFERLGILAMSDFDADTVSVANYDQGSTASSSQGGAWAKEFVDDLLNEAINRKASDIHINPESHGGVVRLRVDGRCEVSKSSTLQSISKERFKLVANNLMERVGKQNNYLEPCSGYLVFQAAHRQVSMRLEMAPVKVSTETQPKVTLRVMNNQRNLARIDQLGLPDTQINALRSIARRANGLVIVTGPTGCGKSTTLKSLLRDIRDHYPEKAIYTIEDPVEDQLEGITSLEITKHMGFPEALKSLLRHDPDVLMVGEIRDRETAELAMRASMTGHLVLTTLHTNDAHGAINRLRNLGLEDSLLAENLLAVTAQRLISRVCSHCHDRFDLKSSERHWKVYGKLRAFSKGTSIVPVANKQGCPNCSRGYAGRHLINEIFVKDPVAERMIAQGVSSTEIRAKQYRSGKFSDLWDDGIRLAQEGVTSLEALEAKINPIHVARAHLNLEPSAKRTESSITLGTEVVSEKKITRIAEKA